MLSSGSDLMEHLVSDENNNNNASHESASYGSIKGEPASAIENKTQNDNSKLDIEQKTENDSSKTTLLINNSEMQYFEWKDVNVTIEGKQILHSISGRLAGGQLLAILGGSGAGKTTLLNAIAGRLLNKEPSTLSKMCCLEKCKRLGTQVTGEVAYFGDKYKLGDSDSIKYISGYVMQSDVQCATSTCHEALKFSSALRMKYDDPLKEEEKINAIIDQLKLNDCKDTKCGNEAIRGLSGGEKKRTSVGIELVTDPNLVFLDEPTSGLDSFTALRTLNILRDLTADKNKMVVATIHQPSSDIFELIDILVLLAKGHVAYFGPAKDVIEYFASLGYNCPQFSNPADYVVNRIQENSEFFIDAWKTHVNENPDVLKLNFNAYGELIPIETQKSSIFKQSKLILLREFEILARDPRPSKIRLAQTIIFSLFVSILYLQLPYDAEGMRDRFGAVFFVTINSSMTGLISTMIVFPEQRLLFERERDNNMYFTFTYVIAKILVQFPEQALFTLVYQLVVYWTVGFDSTFLEVYLALFLCVITTGSFGMVIGCFANTAGEAMNLMPLAFIPMLLFTNFMVSLNQIPVWIRWLQWFDPFKYLVDALVITEFQNQEHNWCCNDDDVCHKLDDAPCQYLYDGNAYLKQLDAGYADEKGLKWWIKDYDDSVQFDWAMLGLLFLTFRFLTIVILVNRNGW